MNEKIIIVGPCSVESPEQLLAAARGLQPASISYLRGGIWKPRTRPGSYEGIGAEGVTWMQDVRRELHVPIITEVANTKQVEIAMKAEFDALWLGARTTVNPFYVQEIAEALKGASIPLFIKNPINPDLNLWVGAIERVKKLVQGEVAAIHRGFQSFRKYTYRNQPQWSIPIALKGIFPDIKLLCDPSHIAGHRNVVPEIAQHAYDLQFDGLMVEVHPVPDQAMSDAAQQLTPRDFIDMLDTLIIREDATDDVLVNEKIEQLRSSIDNLDEQLIGILAERMKISMEIGEIKSEEGIAILQPSRWKWILENALRTGQSKNISEEFLTALFNSIHDASINKQIDVMRQKVVKKL